MGSKEKVSLICHFTAYNSPLQSNFFTKRRKGTIPDMKNAITQQPVSCQRPTKRKSPLPVVEEEHFGRTPGCGFSPGKEFLQPESGHQEGPSLYPSQPHLLS